MCKPEDLAWLDEFNTTELVEIAKFNCIPGFYEAGATKCYPRHIVMRAILKLESPSIPPVLMTERQKLSKFLKKNWGKYGDQVARRQCPECTDGTKRADGKFIRCSDLEVLDCWMTNEDQIL